MPTRYSRWMHAWETRLTSVDNNRVVRPLEWGWEWAQQWPCRNGHPHGYAPDDPEAFLREYNQRIIASSDEFYSYQTPADFRLEHREIQVFSTRAVPDPKLEQAVKGSRTDFLRFTSPVRTPYPENDLVNARWFPAKGNRAVVLLPHWNSDAVSYTGLCRLLNWLGIAVLRLSMPYHDIRRPTEISRADYAVSANIGRTLDATRQGVIDIRCCLDWLEQQNYTQLGILGTSLGSCYSFLAAAHDSRIRVAAFNHASTYFADVVWHGQSTRHIRQGLEPEIDAGTSPGTLECDQSNLLFFTICAMEEKVPDHLCGLRPDFSAGVFPGHGSGVREIRVGPSGSNTALRALHNGRNTLQVSGCMAPGKILRQRVLTLRLLPEHDTAGTRHAQAPATPAVLASSDLSLLIGLQHRSSAMDGNSPAGRVR